MKKGFQYLFIQSVVSASSCKFIFKRTSLFVHLWLCWVFITERGLSPVAESGGQSSLPCAGLSLAGFSRCSSRALEHQLSADGLPCGMSGPPGPRIKPASPALAGRFSTTGPPGKSSNKEPFFS